MIALDLNKKPKKMDIKQWLKHFEQQGICFINSTKRTKQPQCFKCGQFISRGHKGNLHLC